MVNAKDKSKLIEAIRADVKRFLQDLDRLDVEVDSCIKNNYQLSFQSKWNGQVKRQCLCLRVALSEFRKMI